MTTTTEQHCPLCHNNAEYSFRDRLNLKHFHCNNCNEFVISKYAEKHLPRGIPQWRIVLSKEARQTNEKSIFTIKTKAANVANVAKIIDGFDYLKREFVDRK